MINRGRRWNLWWSGLLTGLLITWAVSVKAQLPTNNDPNNQIRFSTPAQADAKRNQLVNFIWSGGLPATLPSVTTNVGLPSQSLGIDPLNVASADRLNVNVSGWNFNSLAYVLHPTNTANANRLAIVHQGHAGNLEAGVGATANDLLQHGFTVVSMMMPLYGWNTDTTASIPGQGGVNYGSHDQMIQNTLPAGGGSGYRLFLEPVVQGINYAQAMLPGLQDVTMIGLSGGGWTTSMMAAIDPRISLSIPIAGSAPLYVRNDDVTQSSYGDLEQTYAPLYNENIQPNGSGGGVATWMEIYALGGFGTGRRQIMVTNEFDNCCFPGRYPDSYKSIVAAKVAALGSGQWEHYLDSTHSVHQISSHVISTIINPALGIQGPTPSRLPIIDDFNNQSGGLPGGWSIDPSSGAGAVAAEFNGAATVQGPGLASIVYNSPFNSQMVAPIRVAAQLNSITTDNFFGVFVTDNIGSRAFHLGALMNMATKELFLNADNGGGFNPTTDRILLGTAPGYTGGQALFGFTFDGSGFSVEFSSSSGASFKSGQRPWSQIPGGFDPANLGAQTQFFIQSYDINGGTPAFAIIDAISITAALTGDFNGDGNVDGADYVLWRNDPTLFGGNSGYAAWRTNFGVNVEAALLETQVPEPTPLLLVLAYLICLSHKYRIIESQRIQP